MDREFTDQQIDRYARHLVLPEIGEEGQARLLDAKVLVIGAGGLGSPLLLYLAAAGVGTLGVVDDDAVDLSNLQRQVLHDTSSIGTPKVESARRRLAEVNPEISVQAHAERLTKDNALQVISAYDLVADGSDNFATRYLVNDACYLARRPLVSAAIMRFDGQLSTYKAFLREAGQPETHPCYRCLFGDQPADFKGSCADVGVLGALAGVLGTLQAVEVIKELLSGSSPTPLARSAGRKHRLSIYRPSTTAALPAAPPRQGCRSSVTLSMVVSLPILATLDWERVRCPNQSLHSLVWPKNCAGRCCFPAIRGTMLPASFGTRWSTKDPPPSSGPAASPTSSIR
jgi:adenylyltransferase/sulfurtransferase